MYMHVFLLFCLGAVAAAQECFVPVSQGDRRDNPNVWTVAQFNVEWLFVDPCSSCPGICTWNTTLEQLRHVNTIRSVLRKFDADTVHICEVQNCKALDKVSPNDAYKNYLIEGQDTYTHQNVGLLTKVDPSQALQRVETRYGYPIENSACGYMGSQGTEGVSKHLISTFVFHEHNLSVALIGAHLLSNPTDPEACAKREAQALVLQDITKTYISQGYEIILIGDFNDWDREVLDMNGNVPTSQVIDLLKGSGQTYTLKSAGSYVSQEERYTEWYDANSNCVTDVSEFSTIDHVLVSPGMANRIESVQYLHLYQEGCGTYESDHYPVLVRFVL
jgi:exonuclease III